ncbi:MAG: hypothetical protein B6D37_06150 [Sphingobacteriales bacterium UTBCD1]|jgi:pimeloyl-ACP methyl ester carboxylesterase|nr:MAG: hypothetical protein B6D37_06150 [Sphingobacteriales bacterium UTBCD1]
MKRKIQILPFIFCLTEFITLFAQSQTANTDSLNINNLPSIPFLPDPLIFNEGEKNIPVKNLAQWQQKKEWIKENYQYWVSGSVPPPPKSFGVALISEHTEGKVILRMVELSFGPDSKAKMKVELMIPPGDRPLPVFMTQWNHRGWAQIAVRRGYIGCVYAGADQNDDTQNYDELFSGYDFKTLMKRAWGASRVIDYLYQLPEVDTARIALTGHSRNGKQSLMAAAFDTRIKAVVSSSGGTGGENTFRWSDERFGSESLEEITRNFPDWFSPRLRWFAGREQKLPVDQNSLMSLIAPRGLMLVSAITEDEGNPWSVEQSYQSVKKVYHFLAADSNIAILLRPGRHQHAARDAEDFLDFFDYIFDRSDIIPENKLYYNYSFENWKHKSGELIEPLKVSDEKGIKFIPSSSTAHPDSIREKIRWLLGDEPPGIYPKIPFSSSLDENSSYPDDYLEEVIGEPAIPDNTRKMVMGPYTGLGDNLWGNIYFPAQYITHNSVHAKLPLVIYLHGYSYATGYHRRGIPIIRHFTEQGFAVLAIDMIGFGTRIEEALHFYDRYPRWSVMGKMVADARSLINDACTRMPFIDTTKIYLMGYSLGGTVALITSALDSRIKGTAVVSAFSSFRNDNTGTEGIRHYYELHGLIPRLGFFSGYEDRIPIDFDDILSCIVPRPLLIIAPIYDRDHNITIVRKTISNLPELYRQNKAANKFIFKQPLTYNHFPDSLQQLIAEWLGSQKIK